MSAVAQPPAPLTDFGSAVTVVIQLLHFERYGLRDRNGFHLELLRDGRQSSSDGIASILECVSTKPFHKFDRAQRRLFKRASKRKSLPFRVSPQTRVYFAYETTRMAFVVDASPTVTSTFGVSSLSSSCCPMDRLVPMARDYFTALIREIPCQNRTWIPEISITVLAVYPKDDTQSPTSLLIRDFRIVDLASAELLLEKLEEWCTGEVESEIAKRLGASKGILSVNASSMHDLLDAGHAALASLSSASRPCILIATDCRSLACDAIIDIASETNRVDVPVSVLDLSPAHTNMIKETDGASSMSDDPTGAIFPLHLSDDSEFVIRLCQATNGAYWNAVLLSQAAKTKAGQVPVSSALNRDHFFTFRRHTFCANAVQWYTLIELSPLSPVPQPEWGRLSPSYSRPTKKRLQARTILQNYEINPAPLHDILLLRVKQGYRAKQCVAGETERFYIHLTLQLDLGTIIHYELSYSAGHPLFGVAQVKIELSGDSTFVLAVKHDFDHGRSGRPVTMAHHRSARICAHAVGLRKEDLMQASVSPIKWPEQLDASGSVFLHRLASLSRSQYCRHFSQDEFECVCHGRMPWEEDDSNECRDNDGQLINCIRTWCSQLVCEGVFIKKIDLHCGVGGYILVRVQRCASASRLFTVSIASFASTGSKRRQEIIAELKVEIQKLQSVEILPKQMAQYLVGHKGQEAGQGANVDPYPFLRILESQYCHESWDLVKDVELIPLVMRRRKEVGKFILLESNEKHTLFAKLIGCQDKKDPGTHVQYKLSVLDDKVVADLHMECESQLFFPLRQQTSKFHTLNSTLRTREKECARALQCRTTILRTIETEDCHNVPGVLLGGDSLASCVRRLLTYASVTSIPLRFFGVGNEAGNRCLRNLTIEALMVSRLGSKVASLAVRDGGAGDWFAVQHDKETLSLVHLSQLSANDDGISNVRVDIHTISLDQMYRKHDDGEGGNADSGFLTSNTHPQVASFRDHIEFTHRRHFSRAAYLSLLIENQEFGEEDINEALSVLDFVQAAEVSIPGESTSQRNLPQMLAKVLTPVVYVPGLFVFERADDLCEWSSLHDQDDDSASDDMTEDVSSQGEDCDNNVGDNGSSTSLEEVNEDSVGSDAISCSAPKEENESKLFSPPVFVRFLKDGQSVDQSELIASINSSKITVLISVFGSTKGSIKVHELRKMRPHKFPRTHAEAAFQISTLLQAYSAEQTLERLRAYGPEIEQSSINDARSCLRKARKVLSTTVNVYFYSTQSDSIVRSYSLSVGDTGVDEGFKLVAIYLGKHQSDQKFVQLYQANTFLAMETQNSSLKYWCFLSIDKIHGVILIDLWHPEGELIANRVMQETVDVIAESCHRVNQYILLRHLHQSRCASDLLVEKLHGTNLSKAQFKCEVVHEETLELYHRCALNVNQVIRTLESSVLQNFAVSNRRSLFVYKDESDSVFYLRLCPRTATDSASIELLVHGISAPGPSIRYQLVNLLKRRLLAIGVDYLASVLTLNPLYAWKEEDLHFVSSFEFMWSKVDDASLDSAAIHPKRERYYSFPEYISDPGLVMLYLRQNILGSSYLYPVFSAESTGQQGDFLSTTTHDDELFFNGSKFLFYFNASRSNLHPEIQAENTLTERGAALARKAGSGLALVTITLDCDNTTKMAVPSSNVKDDNLLDCEPIRLHGHDERQCQEKNTICVSITDTTLDREAIHDLIQLCFNQVIVDWTIERNLEHMQQGQLNLETNPRLDHFLLPGLSHLTNILDTKSSLPHPAIQVVKMSGVIRSSSVSSCLSELLRSIIDEFPPVSKQALADQRITRMSRDGQTSMVRLESLSMKHLSAKSIDKDGNTMQVNKVIDSAIECPEYIAFFATGDSALNTLDEQVFPRVFSDVTVPMTRTSDKSLSDYKRMHLPQFRRSLAYILIVKRNIRKLYAYNWNSKLIQQVSTKLKDINRAYVWRAGKTTETSLSECLGRLAPTLVVSSKRRQKPMTELNDTVSITSDSDKDKEGTQFRKKRSQPIRRPKLVGKSVEGSAAQAVAFSRARARFKPQIQQTNKNVPNATTAESIPLTAQPNRGKSYHVNEEREGVSRMKRNLTAKLNHSANDSVASVKCSFYQAAARSFFRQRNKKLSLQTADFLFHSGAISWVEIAESPKLAQLHGTRVLQVCAVLLCRSMAKLTIMLDSDSIIYLQSKTRTINQCKCFEIIQLKKEELGSKGFRVVAVGRVLRLGRTHDVLRRYVAQCGNEREATAFNVLAANRREQFCLKAHVFDSRMVQLATVSDNPSEQPLQTVFDNLNLLMDGSTLQPVALKSAYKCFQLELKISSYDNRVISLYPCATLIEWLYNNASSRNLLRCSAHNLCFRREVIVNSTSSVLFISPDTTKSTESVRASVLCNTFYQDIECLVKSEHFDFLVTTFDLISYEIAGIVFKELLYAARAIRQGELWELFSLGRTNPSLDNCNEFLLLCYKMSALDVLSNDDRKNFISLVQWCVPNRMLQEMMANNETFWPHFGFQWEDGVMIDVFFLSAENLFLLLCSNHDQTSHSILLLDRNPFRRTSPDVLASLQKLSNCMLHCLWKDAVSNCP